MPTPVSVPWRASCWRGGQKTFVVSFRQLYQLKKQGRMSIKGDTFTLYAFFLFIQILFVHKRKSSTCRFIIICTCAAFALFFNRCKSFFLAELLKRKSTNKQKIQFEDGNLSHSHYTLILFLSQKSPIQNINTLFSKRKLYPIIFWYISAFIIIISL